MKYTLGVVIGIVIIIAGLILWREEAVAPQEAVNEAGNTIATTSPYSETPASSTAPDVRGETPLQPKPAPDQNVACTMDAKQCPDGSYVGRVGPNCEFAACPTPKPTPTDSVVCTDAMKNAEVCPAIYAPVCGLVQVQCIKAPCNPVPETFSSGCNACTQKNVLSYTNGACSAQ